MKRLVIEDIGKPGDPLRLAIEELTPITYPVLGFHVGDQVWLPVEQSLRRRGTTFYLDTNGKPVEELGLVFRPTLPLLINNLTTGPKCVILGSEI